MFLVFDWASAGNLSRSLCLFTTLIISRSICPLSPPRNVLPPATGGHVEFNSTSTSALNQDLMKRHLFQWMLNITLLFRPEFSMLWRKRDDNRWTRGACFPVKVNLTPALSLPGHGLINHNR